MRSRPRSPLTPGSPRGPPSPDPPALRALPACRRALPACRRALPACRRALPACRRPAGRPPILPCWRPRKHSLGIRRVALVPRSATECGSWCACCIPQPVKGICTTSAQIQVTIVFFCCDSRCPCVALSYWGSTRLLWGGRVHGQKRPGSAVRETEVSRAGGARGRPGGRSGRHHLSQQYFTCSRASWPGSGRPGSGRCGGRQPGRQARTRESAAAARSAQRPGAWPAAPTRPAAGGPAAAVARDVGLDAQL
jgi:hypothetical protein